MKLLSSQDELILLVIIKLKRNAYGMTIRRTVSQTTGKTWTLGALYDCLYRLERNGLVKSHLSDPTPERGGRSKRIYTITEEGLRALVEHKKMRDHLWKNFEESYLDT